MPKIVHHLIAHDFIVSPDEQKPRRRVRRPRLDRAIAQVERAGKHVTSITTPDGVTLRFDESECTTANNPWLDDLKATKQ